MKKPRTPRTRHAAMMTTKTYLYRRWRGRRSFLLSWSLIVFLMPSTTCQLQGTTLFGGTQQSSSFFPAGQFGQFFSPSPPGASNVFAQQQIQQQRLQRLQRQQQQAQHPSSLSSRRAVGVSSFFQHTTPVHQQFPQQQTSFPNPDVFNVVSNVRGPPNSPRFAKRPDWRPSPPPSRSSPVSGPDNSFFRGRTPGMETATGPGLTTVSQLMGRSRFPAQPLSKTPVGFPSVIGGDVEHEQAQPPPNSVVVLNDPRDVVKSQSQMQRQPEEQQLLLAPSRSSSSSSVGAAAGFLNLADLYAHVQAVRFYEEGLFNLMSQGNEAEKQQPATRTPSAPRENPKRPDPPLVVEQVLGNQDLASPAPPSPPPKNTIVDNQGSGEVSTEPHPTTIPSNVQVSVVDIPLSTDIPLFGDVFEKNRREPDQQQSTADLVSPTTELSTSTDRTRWTPPKPPTAGIISPLLQANIVAATDVNATGSTTAEEATAPEKTSTAEELQLSPPADLQQILATIDADDLSKLLPPGIRVVHVDGTSSSSAASWTAASFQPTATATVSTTPSSTTTATTSYPFVTRRTKKLPFSFGSNNPMRDSKPDQTVGDVIGSIFGPGGGVGGSKSKSDRKLPSHKTIGELRDGIEFASVDDGAMDPSLLPQDFVPELKTTTTTQKPIDDSEIDFSALFKDAGTGDFKNLLPPGYKLEESTSTTTESPNLADVSKQLEALLLKTLNLTSLTGIDASTFGAVVPTTTTAAAPQEPKIELKEINSSFLPPGFKLTAGGEVGKSDVLSTGYAESEGSASRVGVVDGKAPAVDKPSWLVFPGGARARKPIAAPATPATTVKSIRVTVSAPSRPTTEFTGWPTESTSRLPSPSSSSTEASPTSTRTTLWTTSTPTPTTTTVRSTTAGICGVECRLGATIKIVDGAEWSPALWDRSTSSFRDLSNSLEEELDTVYRNSLLADWYDRVEIEAFSPGSVVVDYVVWLRDLEKRKVDTGQLKKLFFKAVDGLNRRQSRKHDDSPPKGISLGPYYLDPGYTDFVVLTDEIKAPAEDTAVGGYNLPLPQWAIAVIVIGSASLIFVLAFGVTMLVNRRKTSKKRNNKHSPLTDDMLNELSKEQHVSPVGVVGGDGYGDRDHRSHHGSVHGMDVDFDGFGAWHHHATPFAVDGRKYPASLGSRGRIPKIAKVHHRGMYDSWRTDWSGVATYGAPLSRAPSPASTTAYRIHASRRPPDYDTEF